MILTSFPSAHIPVILQESHFVGGATAIRTVEENFVVHELAN